VRIIAAALVWLGAVAQLQSLNVEMQKAHARADWPALRAAAVKQVTFLNGSPDALLELALADGHAAKWSDALARLRSFTQMGQSSDIVKISPVFARLRRDPDFKRILTQMASNTIPVSRARQAFAIPDAGLLPEDIDYDTQHGRFFLTSVLEAKIVTVDARGRIADFARSPDGWPMRAVKIDSRRGLVWATEVVLDGVKSVAKRDWGRSAILEYDLETGKLLGRVEGPRESALGDMALRPNGDLLISDAQGGGVYIKRNGADQLKRIDNGDFVSPETPAYASSGQEVLVPDYVRGLGLLDVDTGRVRWIPMDGAHALEGIDGMYFHGRSLLAIQNGTNPVRVISFGFDAGFMRVTSQRIIESGTAGLDPTHGVLVGNAFYYIWNAGWNSLDDSGNLKPGSVLTRARVMRASL
jgi:hypothetical protein